MRILSIEMSTSLGSIALLDNDQLVASYSWEEERYNREHLFNALEDMGIDWDSIDHYLVGRGPGSFSGMRFTFSVANSLAAPSKTSVIAHNSGSALAYAHGELNSIVLGDARRKQLWIGEFNGTELVRGFNLIDPSELPNWVRKETIIISPDYDRLSNVFLSLGDKKIISMKPNAVDLAKVVSYRLNNELDVEQFEPLYLHPPVFVKPKFPA